METIRSIQYLRALAAILVVLHHAQIMLPGTRIIIPYYFANAGVYLFFAISGFLMVRITNKNTKPIDFLRNRIVRIAPLYWLATIAAALTHPDIYRIIMSLLFIPHNNSAGVAIPILGVGWTLNYEMFFYFLFFIGLSVNNNYRTLIVTIILGFFYFLQVPFYGSAIVLQFAIGMAIGNFNYNSNKSPCLFFTTFTIACLIMTVGDQTIDRESDWQRLTAYGLPTAAILLSALMNEKRFPRWRWLQNLGDSSYSIYLFHMFTMVVARYIWKFFHIKTDTIISIASVLTLSGIGVVFGIIINKFIEKPLLAKLKRTNSS